jgi:hypothetical protein
MSAMGRLWPLCVVAILCGCASTTTIPVSDPKAIELAEATMRAMGGRKAWEQTRCIRWTFFGGRKHLWDKHAGIDRIDFQGREGKPYTLIIDLDTKRGRAWIDGREITDAEQLAGLMNQAEAMWINDSYWLVMPFKLRDPGVRLRHLGEQALPDGRAADVLELTFENVGRTPENKYHVWIARDTKLVEQWAFFDKAADDEPKFTMPWRNWQRHGRILLSDDRGERDGRPIRLLDVAVPQTVPASAFTSPDPPTLPATPVSELR